MFLSQSTSREVPSNPKLMLNLTIVPAGGPTIQRKEAAQYTNTGWVCFVSDVLLKQPKLQHLVV